MPRVFDELTCVDTALHRDDCGVHMEWDPLMYCSCFLTKFAGNCFKFIYHGNGTLSLYSIT